MSNNEKQMAHLTTNGRLTFYNTVSDMLLILHRLWPAFWPKSK